MSRWNSALKFRELKNSKKSWGNFFATSSTMQNKEDMHSRGTDTRQATESMESRESSSDADSTHVRNRKQTKNRSEETYSSVNASLLSTLKTSDTSDIRYDKNDICWRLLSMCVVQQRLQVCAYNSNNNTIHTIDHITRTHAVAPTP